MPNRREEDTGRGTTRTHGHSHIPRMRNDPHAAHTTSTAFSKAYHENGLDSTMSAHNGKNKPPPEPPDNIAQTKQKEHGFETFVMTGDMIIRTTKKSEPARKPAVTVDKIPKKVLSSPSREPSAKTPADSASKAKSKGSPAKSQGSPAKSHGSPSKSLQGSPSKSSQGSPAKTQGSPSKSQGSPSKIPGSPSPSKCKKAESRIPMPSESRIPMASKSRIPKPPSQRGSPKHTPKQSPKLPRAPLSFPRNERTVTPSMASPESMDIENLEAVNNNVIQNVAKSEETVELLAPPTQDAEHEPEMDLTEDVQRDADAFPELSTDFELHHALAPETLALRMAHPGVRQSAQSPLSPPEPVFDLELSPEVELVMEEHMDEEVEEECVRSVSNPPPLEASGADHYHMFTGDSIMSRSTPVSSLGYMSFAGFRFPDVDMALDIPPDDISSEDDSYKNMESSLVDVDDLPPPPDELLQDLNKPEPLPQPLTPYPVSAILLRDNYVAASAAAAVHQASNGQLSSQSDHQAFTNGSGAGHKHVSYEPTTLETVEETEGATNLTNREASPAITVPGVSQSSNVISKSAEKIAQSRGPGVRYPTQSVGVRTSRSQENYFQSTADGMALVDIDFDESMASSVDALPYSYSEKSSTSLDTVSMPGHVPMHDHHTHEISRSVDNSPERNYDKYSDRMHMPTFISIDQQEAVGVSHVKPQPHSQSQPPPKSHHPARPGPAQSQDSRVNPNDNRVFSSQEIPEAEPSRTPSAVEDQRGALSASTNSSECSSARRGQSAVPGGGGAPHSSPTHSTPRPARTDNDHVAGEQPNPAVLTLEGATVTSSSDGDPEEMGPNACGSGGGGGVCGGAGYATPSPPLSGSSSPGTSPGRRRISGGGAHPSLLHPAAVAPLAVAQEDDTSTSPELLPPDEDVGARRTDHGAGGAVPDTPGAREEGPCSPHLEVEDQGDMVAASSGPPSLDGGESDSESIYHQPIKEVDRPSASRLAKRLFHNDGFKKQDISRHLHKKNDFAQLVGEEYLKFFDFTSDTLEQALRKFLRHLTLAGETQERERVLAHFSSRYMECNPVSFKSEDSCHTLTCALMLLNTDLHGQNIGRKMTLNEFIDNLAELNDGNNFPTETLKQLYSAIKTEPLECEIDEEIEKSVLQAISGSEQDVEDLEALAATGRAQVVPPPEQRFIGHNPFLDVPDPSKATEYKKGYVMRKCCLDADGRRTPIGKRGWKMFYATLRDMVLYLHKDEHAMKKTGMYDNMSNAIRIHHGLATKAADYTKKQHVFRLHTADGAQYLFQTSDSKECQEWMDTINFVAASFSAPPLPGGVGSQKKFQRPLMPSSYTKLNLREQLLHHEQQVQQREQDLHDHQLYPPEKGAKSRVIQDYVDKERFLQFEMKRFKTYLFLLQAKIASFPELEPSLVEVAIGEVEEPLPSPQSSHTSRVSKPTSQSPSQAANEQSRSKSVQRSMSDRLCASEPLFRMDMEWPPETLRDPYMFARETCV